MLYILCVIGSVLTTIDMAYLFADGLKELLFPAPASEGQQQQIFLPVEAVLPAGEQAGDDAQGELLGVAHQIAQVDHMIRLLLLDGLHHAGEEVVGVGKNEDLHIVTLSVQRHILELN